MSENVTFRLDNSMQPDSIIMERSWEQSVPLSSDMPQSFAGRVVLGCNNPGLKAGYDGVPGPVPVAVPSTNTRYFQVP